jgi:serine/threonine protein kinase
VKRFTLNDDLHRFAPLGRGLKNVQKITMTKRADYREVKELGRGGQSKVFLVQISTRVIAQGLSAVDVVAKSGALTSENVESFARSIWNIARPDNVSELGALKTFIPRENGPDSERQMIGRLKKEISILAENRAGLIKMLDFNSEEHWLVTEYYPYGTLEQNLIRYKGDPYQTLSAFRSLVATVAALHKDGIVHRDIKPDNIFVDSEEHLILGDFGIVFDRSGAERPTGTGESVGACSAPR